MLMKKQLVGMSGETKHEANGISTHLRDGGSRRTQNKLKDVLRMQK